VPTAAERSGDFSALTDSSGRPIIIYDPLTTDAVTGARQPFPGNKIPANRINVVGANIVKYLPMPNTGNTRSTTAVRTTQRKVLQTISASSSRSKSITISTTKSR
jgi:hypothetical protein